MTTTFIGIDLAWNVEARNTGVAVLKGGANAIHLHSVSEGLHSSASVVQFAAGQSTETTVVAVDCSLVVTNRRGQRRCETQISKKFGKYHASCHSTNLQRRYAHTGMNLVRALARHGFVHDFVMTRARGRKGRWMFEVYPHPAMIRLFELPRIISYKKGLVDERRKGLRILQDKLASLTNGGALRMNNLLRGILSCDVSQLQGAALKRHEDTLDAIFCAYLAWYCWRWGEARNEMTGTLADGYIVVPSPRVGDF